MRSLVRRRVQNAAIAFLAVACVWSTAHRMELRLYDSHFFTGWVLLAATAFLALLQLRKKLPAPSLGSASTWVQAHIYTGVASGALFLIHASGWPAGRFETALAALFALTFVSGVIGLYWTRTLPRRLIRVGEEVIYERIAAIRGQLRQQAETAVLTTVRGAGSATLGEFYNARLQNFFSNHRGWRYRLFPTATLRKSLMAELTEASRYLSDAERATAEALFALVRKRDDLDYHEALLWRLRAWLFVHVALTYPLLATAAVHAWLVHLYQGGAA